MTVQPIDALEVAKAGLAASMTPAPDDLLADLGPLSRLYFVEQLAYELLGRWAADLAADENPDPGLEETAGRALEGIAAAAGALDAACIAMGILPSEAGEQTV